MCEMIFDLKEMINNLASSMTEADMKMTLGYKIIQKIVIRLDLEMNKAYTSMF
jgi:hypothetical protein